MKLISIALLITLVAYGCAFVPPETAAPAPADLVQPAPEPPSLPDTPSPPAPARTVNGDWFLDTTDYPGEGYHLFGEPFVVGSWFCVLVVENDNPRCVSPVDGDRDEERIIGLRPAYGLRPVVMTETHVQIKFKMNFHPTWYGVFDELLNERQVEITVSGTRIGAADAFESDHFDVIVERRYVVSGHTITGTGTLKRIDPLGLYFCQP